MGEGQLGVGMEGADGLGHERAYEVWEGRIGEVKKPCKVKSLSLVGAARRVWGLLEQVGKEDVSVRMERVPGDLFRAEQVGELGELAGAAVYVQVNQLRAKALEKGVESASTKLPKALVVAVKAQRERMSKVVEYHLGDKPHVRRLLAEIRAHRRHQDWASDLDNLCGVYRAYEAELQKDAVHYSAEDVQKASALAFQMHGNATRRRLQQKPSAYWLGQGAKLMAVLGAIYEDVWKTARWVMRDLPEEELERRFPALFAGLGGRPRKPKPPKKPRQKREKTTKGEEATP